MSSDTFRKIVPILRPQEIKEKFPDFSGGVGTPYMLFNSNTGAKWLLFTGWKNGLKREGAVAPIEKDLTVDTTKIRKILPSDTIPGNYTISVVRGIYNALRDEYIVTATQDNKAYIFWFDSNWNKVESKCIMEFPTMVDHGVAFKPIGHFNVHDAIAAIPSNSRLKLLAIRNVDDPEKVKVEDYGIAAWHGALNDVLDLTLMPEVTVISESAESGKWILKMFMGPPISDIKTLDPKGGIPAIGLLAGNILPTLMIDDIFVQVGHPHYTTEPDGNPKLLFATFRDSWSTAKGDPLKELARALGVTEREAKEKIPDFEKFVSSLGIPEDRLLDLATGFTHEIYAAYVDESIFDPRNYGFLVDRVFIPGERDMPSKWYWVGPAREILLSITNVKGNRASIEVSEATSLINVDDAVTSKFEVSEECGKLTIKNPSLFIRLNSIEPAPGPVWLTAKY